MCKESWCVELGRKGLYEDGRGNKDFKRGGGQAGSRSGCLKKGRLELPYELRIVVINTTSEKVE